MKLWKKTLVLVMALGMTAGFAACGGGSSGGKKEPAGEQLEAGTGWAAAWEATLSAPNVTLKGSYSYSMYVKEDLWNEMHSEGVIYLADNKIYSEGEYVREWDYTGQGHDAGSVEGISKYYMGMKDGDLYDWYYDEETNTWDEELSYSEAEGFGTAFFLMEEQFEVDMDRYDYLAWEALATYADGVYTLSYADEDESETYQFKFVDGKIYSFAATMTEIAEEGFTSTISQSYVVSYGDAKVGKLPYEEGFENEKPEEGGDVGGGTVGGEEIGGESVLGENVETLEEWNTIYANSCAQTNIVGVQTGQMLGQQSTTNLSIQDGKVYMVNVDSVSGTRYRYVGVVDGVQYSWTSSDNATWDCYEETDVMPLTAEYVLSDLAGVPFDKLTYDEEKGVMVYAGIENGQNGRIEIKVVDGKIVSYSMVVYDGDGNIVYSSINTIQYGKATVGELPPVENVGEGGGVVVGPGVVDPNPSNPGGDNFGGNEDIGGGKEEVNGNNATLK